MLLYRYNLFHQLFFFFYALKKKGEQHETFNYLTTGQDFEKYGEQSYAFRDAAIVMNNFFIDPALIDVYVEKIKNGELADTQEFSADALLRGVILAVFDWKF